MVITTGFQPVVKGSTPLYIASMKSKEEKQLKAIISLDVKDFAPVLNISKDGKEFVRIPTIIIKDMQMVAGFTKEEALNEILEMIKNEHKENLTPELTAELEEIFQDLKEGKI